MWIGHDTVYEGSLKITFKKRPIAKKSRTMEDMQIVLGEEHFRLVSKGTIKEN